MNETHPTPPYPLPMSTNHDSIGVEIPATASAEVIAELYQIMTTAPLDPHLECARLLTPSEAEPVPRRGVYAFRRNVDTRTLQTTPEFLDRVKALGPESRETLDRILAQLNVRLEGLPEAPQPEARPRDAAKIVEIGASRLLYWDTILRAESVAREYNAQPLLRDAPLAFQRFQGSPGGGNTSTVPEALAKLSATVNTAAESTRDYRRRMSNLDALVDETPPTPEEAAHAAEKRKGDLKRRKQRKTARKSRARNR